MPREGARRGGSGKTQADVCLESDGFGSAKPVSNRHATNAFKRQCIRTALRNQVELARPAVTMAKQWSGKIEAADVLAATDRHRNRRRWHKCCASTENAICGKD
jgi:hypothetical protein